MKPTAPQPKFNVCSIDPVTACAGFWSLAGMPTETAKRSSGRKGDREMNKYGVQFPWCRMMRFIRTSAVRTSVSIALGI